MICSLQHTLKMCVCRFVLQMCWVVHMTIWMIQFFHNHSVERSCLWFELKIGNLLTNILTKLPFRCKLYAYHRNCKNLPPLLQIHRHNQFLKSKLSSKDNLLLKDELQLIIDPHRAIKLSSSELKNEEKQTPSFDN